MPKAAYILRDSPSPPELPAQCVSSALKVREIWQEGRELGVRKTVARSVWELKTRSGIARLANTNSDTNTNTNLEATFHRIFSEPSAVAGAVRHLISPPNLSALAFQASEATRGRILCFGKWVADFGNPIDWHRNPLNQNRWRADAHWSHVLAGEKRVGDVKLNWEAARFPQAYSMARCAALFPETAPDLSAAFLSQVQNFLECNPTGKGIHWSSGQEMALRLMAWLFGLNVFFHNETIPADLQTQLGKHISACGAHIARHIEYARESVYNNHLLSEALALYIAGRALPDVEAAPVWVSEGRRLLEQEANCQFYPDGSYIQQSHNYHRFAIQIYLWALAFATSHSDPIPPDWIRALERSLDFLLAHQNPADGRLPNYGANDGARPLPLSSCDFSDFRPTLQAASIMIRHERIYGPGPWDEMAAWFGGPSALEVPLRKAKQTSVSFSHTGHHVLRGRQPENFAAFRCGTIIDRFSQIDMLHLDVWWHGHNVLADPGSYLYNGPEEWHDHFLRTEGHNTVQVDGRDQMLHYRKFKCLYWTKAKLLRFDDNEDWALCEGEHYGYQRHPGRSVHHRSVLFVKDELWIVVDRIGGSGSHRVRLHWLGGDFPYRTSEGGPTGLQLITPDGPFHIGVFNAAGGPISSETLAGRDDPPRGWISRSYAEKVSAPSLSVELSGRLPLTMVSILGPHVPLVSVAASSWSVTAGDQLVEFALSAEGTIQPRSVTPALVSA